MDLLAVALIAVLAIAAVLLLFSRQNKDYGKQLDQLHPKKKAKGKREFGVYTLAEVAQHNTPDDAWIIIQHKDTKEWRVYDVTEYKEEHPGGDVILNNVGGDATEGFHGPHHPVTTFVIVEEFCVGKLAEGEAPK